MKRKTSDVPSRTWKYGLPFGPLKEHTAAVEAQFVAGRKYANQLIEIELRRRKLYRELRTALVPEMAAAELEYARCSLVVDELMTSIKRQHAAEQSKDHKAADHAALLAAKRDRTEARAKLKEARAFASENTALKDGSTAINAAAVLEVKAARAATEAYWGTGGLHDRAAEAQRASKIDPVFRRWDGTGRIGVHMQPPVSVADLMGEGSRQLRIGPVGHRGRCMLMMRIGSSERGREPIWAYFPMVLHRPLPPDALINDAWVQRHRVGTRWRWEVCISMRSQSFVAPPRLVQHACGVDIGWRKLGDGSLRCAMIVGSDGVTEEITVSANILGRLEHADSLRSIRDRNLTEVLVKLLAGIPTLPALPEWWADATESLSQWRSQARLTSLVLRWKDHRFAGDEALLEVMDAWRKQDRHLLQWESHERTRALGHRRELYRIAAARIATRYAQVVVEDMDLREFQRIAEAGENSKNEQVAVQRAARTRVALSEWLDALKLACQNRGASFVRVPPQYTTANCHVCGSTCEINAIVLWQVCSQCGAGWDLDVNAARNLLALGQKLAS